MRLNDVNHCHVTYQQLQDIGDQGNSFYFIDFEQLENNYTRLFQAFKSRYHNSQIAYSFKTNYAPLICEALKLQGSWAEVVSEMEYEIATSVVGFEPKKVIVNGPIHTPEFIEKSMLDGALLNADAWYILDIIACICSKYPKHKFKIGIRLSYEITEGGFSRFGIESSTYNLQRLADWIKPLTNCEIVGFHSHFSNSSRSSASFTSRIEGLLKASSFYFGEKTPHLINIGGGFFGEMPDNLACQYPGKIPSFDDYAQTITKAIKRQFKDTKVLPKLLLEPGTALVANAMVFVCKVHEVKQVRGQTVALVNGSNHNVNHKWQGETLPIQIIRKNKDITDESRIQSFDIVANTCIEKDVICTNVKGSIKAGDFIIFQYMGGYSTVLKQPFIHPCQAIYGRYKQQLITVKKQETVVDILSSYLSTNLFESHNPHSKCDDKVMHHIESKRHFSGSNLN